MQSEQPKYGYGMTCSACLWLGLFPLLQRGTYATLTHDKWIIMMLLTGVTLVCFLVDLILRRRVAKDLLPHSFLPLAFVSALLLWTVLSCLFSSYGPDARITGSAEDMVHLCAAAEGIHDGVLAST